MKKSVGGGNYLSEMIKVETREEALMNVGGELPSGIP